MINIIISAETPNYKIFLNNLPKEQKEKSIKISFPENYRTNKELKVWLSKFLSTYDKTKQYYILTRSNYLLSLITIANKAYSIKSLLNEEGIIKLDQQYNNLIISGDEIVLIEAINKTVYKIIPHYKNMLSDDNLLNNSIRDTNNDYSKLLGLVSMYYK